MITGPYTTAPRTLAVMKAVKRSPAVPANGPARKRSPGMNRATNRVAYYRRAREVAYESVALSLSYCVPCCTCAAWPSSAACGPADARNRVGGRALGLVLCGSLSCSLLPGLTARAIVQACLHGQVLGLRGRWKGNAVPLT